ncbi:MAG: methyltransferase domain-containing protein [Candidatus Acidiferrales bacterium]
MPFRSLTIRQRRKRFGLSARSQVRRLQADFVCADADAFPIRTNSMGVVFSYRVLQHLERSKVCRFFEECFRVLKPGGLCLIQMPNRFGLVSILQQARRGFAKPARIHSKCATGRTPKFRTVWHPPV